MSLSSSLNRLKSSARDLRLLWDRTTSKWDDTVSRDFEERHLVTLERRVKEASDAIARMGNLVSKAERDCR
jgi:hypothetical protein